MFREYSLGRALPSPLFLICAVLIAAAAVGLRPGMAALAAHYVKESIDLRRPLAELRPAALPSFRPASHRDPPSLPSDDIGTEDAVYLPIEGRRSAGTELEPSLFVTYYSDPDDQVPHTPDVCYRQGGYIVNRMTTETIDVSGLGPEHAAITASIIDFVHKERRRVVIYMFCACGDFCHSREQVRWVCARLRYRYVYFSKIEALVTYYAEEDADAAAEMARQLLREALPVLVAEHYPRTEDLMRR